MDTGARTLRRNEGFYQPANSHKGDKDRIRKCTYRAGRQASILFVYSNFRQYL